MSNVFNSHVDLVHSEYENSQYYVIFKLGARFIMIEGLLLKQNNMKITNKLLLVRAVATIKNNRFIFVD